ncbi:MAG: cation acetate symporter [Zoogloeaceae bacterium]|jgi:cation/acetate symporter|nr:cation acetate symporter [Zoogloeaceae bacterium]
MRFAFQSGAAAMAWMAIPVWAETQERQPASLSAIAACVVTLLIVLAAARWAAEHAYAASYAHTDEIDRTGRRGGLALCGAYLSAAAFLGIPALISAHGYDVLILLAGLVAGWPLLALLLAERLHNLSVLTFADAPAWRLQRPALRVLLAVNTLIVCLIYLVAQMVGAGQIVSLLFGFEYWLAVVIVGGVMLAYALICGRIALTWLQIVKAIFLLACTALLAGLVVWKLGFSADTLYAQALELKTALDSGGGEDLFGEVMATGKNDMQALAPNTSAHTDFFHARDPVSILSLGLTLIFGVLGLPHLLMRFAQARNARIARQSALWATVWIGVFAVLLCIVGLGIVTLDTKTHFMDAFMHLSDSNELSLLFLAYALGDHILMGIIAAAALVTLLAVTAGLGHAAATAVAHDLYATTFMQGRTKPASERKITRQTITLFFMLAILLGIACAGHSLVALVTLALAIAASANAPVLLMVMFWKGCTSRGAVAGGLCGLFSALLLILFSPPVWENILHQERALFAYALPTLFSMSAAFLGVWIFSLTDRSPRARWERAAWPDQQFRAALDLGEPPVFTEGGDPPSPAPAGACETP